MKSNRLIYSELSVLARLSQLWDAHLAKYKVSPKEILMDKGALQIYLETLGVHYPKVMETYKNLGFPRCRRNGRWWFCVTYKGVPILIEPVK